MAQVIGFFSFFMFLMALEDQVLIPAYLGKKMFSWFRKSNKTVESK